MKGIHFVVSVSVLLLTNVSTVEAGPLPEIRVLVIDNVSSVTIEGTGSVLKIVSQNRRPEERAGTLVRITAGSNNLVMNGADRGPDLFLTCAGGRYRVGDRMFRGALSVHWKAKGSLQVVDTLSIENYLAGLINSEISSSWPIEAIKAQAVAARTYAMHQIESARKAQTLRPYDITSTVADQVYDGAHQEDDRSEKAVAATRGEFLLRNGSIFSAFYHSCCGGHTEHAHNVWPGEEGPPTIDDMYCTRSPKLLWSFKIPIRQFIDMLKKGGVSLNTVGSIATAPFGDSDRNDVVLIEDNDGMKTIRAADLRRVIGYQQIKSTWFTAKLLNGAIAFEGRGYGHGVGLCQWGAKGMALAGINYRDILSFYYPDAEVVRLY